MRFLSVVTLCTVFTLCAPGAFAQVGEAMATLKQGICGKAWMGLENTEVSNREAVFKERFLAAYAEIESILQSGLPPREIALKLMEGPKKPGTDNRGYLFHNEELGRFYWDFFKKAGDKKELEALFQLNNDLEDILGQAIDKRKVPVKLAKVSDMPKAAIDLVTQESEQAIQALEDLLVRDGWIGKKPKTLQRWVDFIMGVKAPSQEWDSAFLEQQIIEDGEKVQNTVYDTKQLQGKGGTHAERRDVRKLDILFQAARGRIEIVDDVVPQSLLPYQEISEESKPYMAIPQPTFKIKHPVQVRRSAFNATSFFVNAIGEVKDRGEIFENAMHALTASHTMTEHEARLWLMPRLVTTFKWKPWVDQPDLKPWETDPNWTPWAEDAAKLDRQLKESNVLRLLIMPKQK